MRTASRTRHLKILRLLTLSLLHLSLLCPSRARVAGAFARVYSQSISVFQVAANNVKEEQEFNEKTKDEKTFSEIMEDFLSGALLNCSSSGNSCTREHRVSTMEHKSRFALPSIDEEREVGKDGAIRPRASAPRFCLPQTPSNTFQR